MNKVRGPRWTVLFNTKGDGEWIGRAFAFFDKVENAEQFYQEQSRLGLVPTMRPFHRKTDLEHLNVLQARDLERTLQ